MAPPAGKRIAIVQPCYIPWKGYFDIIARCGEFVLFDDVQFVKRTWYNRNLVKGSDGPHWLTIPVRQSGRRFQKISETEIADPNWAEEHFAYIARSYKRAPFFSEYEPALRAMYEAAAACPTLDKADEAFIRHLCGILGVTTPIVSASDLDASGKATDRLLDICLKRGASIYLSGPAAKAYFREETFSAAGVAVEWMDYGGYPEYPQLGAPFEHGVSVIDLILNTGPEAPRLMKFASPGEDR